MSMSYALLALIVFIGIGVGVWLVSHIVEGLRPVPQAPQTLRWAPAIPIKYIEVEGHRLRYIRAGARSKPRSAPYLAHAARSFRESGTGFGETFHSVRARLPRSRLFGYPENAIRRRFLCALGRGVFGRP